MRGKSRLTGIRDIDFPKGYSVHLGKAAILQDCLGQNIKDINLLDIKRG
jgi:hypothetical protein